LNVLITGILTYLFSTGPKDATAPPQKRPASPAAKNKIGKNK
jgi:hypothetical protein